MPEYIVINDDLRTMTIPESIVLLGVESDDDVNRIPFRMPKEYCGYNLSEFSARINYMNQKGQGDIYIIDDLAVDGDYMTFTWLVGRNACAYKGKTKFVVCLKKFADDGETVVQEFNTTVYSLPVLEGLETVDAVEQQNADIIEYILYLIEQSGTVDPSNYYTKSEVDALIPTELPNPYALTINGTNYDGSEAVEMTVEATSEEAVTVSGKMIHVADAVPNLAAESLILYDENDDPVASAEIAVTNKNLFRIDALDDQTVSKGITFTKQSDGSILCNGTSTDTFPMISCNMDKNMFDIGNTYTLSSGKEIGYAYVQLTLNYTDSTAETIFSKNSARSFTVEKEVESCIGSIQIAESGVTLSNEVVSPQLEMNYVATTFVMNIYNTLNYDGSVLPVLPDYISNLWSTDDDVANMVMEYEADLMVEKIDDYVNANVQPRATNGTLIATYNGEGTVMIAVG